MVAATATSAVAAALTKAPAALEVATSLATGAGDARGVFALLDISGSLATRFPNNVVWNDIALADAQTRGLETRLTKGLHTNTQCCITHM